MAELADCRLFNGLPRKELGAIAGEFREVHHPAGKEVMVRGSNGVGFMVILEGEATIETPGGGTKRLRPGDYFGEMALLDHQGRSTSVTAATDLKLAALPEWSFKTFLEAHPEVSYRLLEGLSRRIREAEAR
jgi:CRP-like cAMP-binding protein